MLDMAYIEESLIGERWGTTHVKGSRSPRWRVLQRLASFPEESANCLHCTPEQSHAAPAGYGWVAGWAFEVGWQAFFLLESPAGMWMCLALILGAFVSFGRALLRLYGCASPAWVGGASFARVWGAWHLQDVATILEEPSSGGFMRRIYRISFLPRPEA